MDAAIAMAASLSLIQPTASGIGGDSFVLYYRAKDKKVYGVNGSGRSSSTFSVSHLRSLQSSISPLFVTVPGAASCWCSCISNFGSGKFSLLDLFQPTIDLARSSFPVPTLSSREWNQALERIQYWNKNIKEGCSRLNGVELMNEKGSAPLPGELFRNESLANVLETVGKEGEKGFYESWVSEAIVNSLINYARTEQEKEGILRQKDLSTHSTEFVEPICTNYEGIDIWEIPPNGQGITVLMALNLLESMKITDYIKNPDIGGSTEKEVEYLHRLIESLRISFSDSFQYVCDLSQIPKTKEELVNHLLSKEYAQQRVSQCFSNIHANPCQLHGSNSPVTISPDTTYFCTADQEGNMCSYIGSTFDKFGCGIVPEKCGFTLQSRGRGFRFTEDDEKACHLNLAGPSKRPYHTIIPGMATQHGTNLPYCAFGVMGGFMQPQGQVQVLMNMIHRKMDPQSALDYPRIMLGSNYYPWDSKSPPVTYEDGIDDESMKKLKEMGHNIIFPVCKDSERFVFGRGHIVKLFSINNTQIVQQNQQNQQNNQTYVWVSGADPRSDGCALAY